jgi:hypothetical protein
VLIPSRVLVGFAHGVVALGSIRLTQAYFW